MYHRSCKTLSLKAFIDINTEQDLTPLIISGNPTKEQLAEAWQEIMEEYAGLLQSDKSLYFFQLQKEIKHLEVKMKIVEGCISYLRQAFSSEIQNILIDNGYWIDLDPGNKEAYIHQLNMLETETKNLVIFHKNKVTEFNKLAEENNEGSKRSRMDFEKDIAVIEKWKGGAMIDREKTTVFTWCANVNLYMEFVNQQTKKEAA